MTKPSPHAENAEAARLETLTRCLDQIMASFVELTRAAAPDATALKTLQTKARMSASLIRQYLNLETLRGVFNKRQQANPAEETAAKKTDTPAAILAATQKTLATAQKNKSKLKRRLKAGHTTVPTPAAGAPLPGLLQPAMAGA